MSLNESLLTCSQAAKCVWAYGKYFVVVSPPANFAEQHVFLEWRLFTRPTIWSAKEYYQTIMFPWVSLLVCKYVRSCTAVPFTSFVLQRNTSMRAHRDLNNAHDSVNVVLPCSSFTGGGLWLRSPNGDGPSMAPSADMCKISPDIASPLPSTPPRRQPASLTQEDIDTLRRLEFALPAQHSER
ncbi:unnamed protein product [Symbiodinium sp. CCMP2592]|nr:unnamed protein product [Symbiodinium sp. CCMP2592]